MDKKSRRKAKFEKIMTNLLMSSDEEEDDIDMSIKNSTISPPKDDVKEESDCGAVGRTRVQLLILFKYIIFNHRHKVLK